MSISPEIALHEEYALVFRALARMLLLKQAAQPA
jgi:hypothetical protein